MALQERDRNKGRNGKREHDVIDLTDDEPPAKVQRSAAAFNAQRNAPPRTTANITPPASSAPRSSQSAGRNAPSFSQLPTYTLHSETERESWLAEDDDDDDLDAAMPSTQAAAVNYEQLHLYGDLPTKIVGVQYYRGFASAGEQILMKREPGNPYDRNAIRIDNVTDTQ